MKTRFAPSPTGRVHLGNIRTALFNVLLAHAHDAPFMLRIEDTDRERSKACYAQDLMDDMRWLGLDWQEGVDAAGKLGPYRQSERADIYAQYYQMLLDKGLAYPCFCSEEQLAVSRKLQRARGQAPRYAGTCAGISADEAKQRIAAGEQSSLRFRVPKDEVIAFDDYVKGRQSFQSNDIGDFIIRRSSGSASFMFCSALDDALMAVTHVLRGEDHLTNTPRQLMILSALGLQAPIYGHISLITGSNGAPLSKRNGSRSVQDLKEQGFLPLAIVNYLARLGHYYADNALMSLAQLADQFTQKHLSQSPARFDEVQLLFWQRQVVAIQTVDELLAWMGEELLSALPAEKHALFVKTIQPNIVFAHDAKKWVGIFSEAPLAFSDEATSIINTAGSIFFKTAAEGVKQFGVDNKAVCEHIKTTLQVKGKSLFMPLRVALTGETHGPEMVGIFALLGADRLIQRLEGLST
jgi:glutamyl-tRNA synthetase